MERKEKYPETMRYYFSINDQGKLLLAEIETTRVEKVTDREDKILDIKEDLGTKYNVTIKEIDYKNLISQYTTPMSFFLTLGMTTRNPEFLADVANLVQESAKIHLKVITTKTTEVTTRVDKYTEHIRTRTVIYDMAGNAFEETDSEDIDVVETTTTTVTTIVPTVKVTSVNTWVCSQTIQYNKLPNDEVEQDLDSIEQESDPPESLSEDADADLESVSWITREPSTVHIKTTVESYDSGTPSEYTDNTDGFIQLLDKKYKIPNSKEQRTAGAYLKTDADMLFALLQQNSETQGMEQIMRYIMYKYTGKDYGVTELDFSVFDVNYFNKYNGGVLGSNIEEKVWFSLRNMGFSEYAVAGVMGNIKWESSGFNPSAMENGGKGEGIGLCQWSFDRKTSLIKYATSKGKTWEDENIQVEFLMGELTPGGGADGYASYALSSYNGYSVEMWKNANNASDAAVAFCWVFEKPGDPHIEERKTYAEEYYTKYKGRTIYEGATDSIQVGEYTFPHYLQRNYDHRFGSSTISASGCGPTSLSMVLAGLTKNPGITPITVVESLENYYPSYSSYYQPGAGVITSAIVNNNFLGQYYNVKSTKVSTEEGVKQVESGKVAIGSVSGHILAIVPVPEQYKNQGYRFYIMDSGRGLDGPYRSEEEVKKKPRSYGVFNITYILETK